VHTKACNIKIAQTLEKVSGKKVIVDSSKELTRALFLLRFVSGTKVIHLVRHPAGVLRSHLNRLSDGQGFKILRRRFKPKKWFFPFVFLGAAGWVIGNSLVECVKMFRNQKVLRVRYEDLIDFPLDEIGRIEKFLGLSLEDLRQHIMRKSRFGFGHNIGGNHIRMSKGFVLEKGGRSFQRLPKKHSMLVHVLCWPLIWKYGYYRT